MTGNPCCLTLCVDLHQVLLQSVKLQPAVSESLMYSAIFFEHVLRENIKCERFVKWVTSDGIICTLRVIGNYPRRTPIPCLHAALNVIPIRDFIYHLTTNFFDSCSAHPDPLVCSIGNYSLADLHRQYKKYIHKRPKHLL